MIFNSLKSRIILSVTGLIVISFASTVFFVGQKAENGLLAEVEANAVNLLQAKKFHVESQYNSILYHKNTMLERRKTEIKNNIEIAYKVIEKSWMEYKNGTISEKVAKQRAFDYVRHLRYDNSVGYFWISDTDRPLPLILMHSAIPGIEGTYLDAPRYNCALGRGENLTKAMVDVCLETGAGFVDYLWEKPTAQGLTELQPKISYVKLFKPWQWIVGTGVYIDDIEKDVQARIDAVIEDLNKTINKQKVGESGYFFIFDQNNYMLVHPTMRGRDMSNVVNPSTGNLIIDDFRAAVDKQKSVMEYLWDKPDYPGEFRFMKKAYLSFYEPLNWYICSSVYKEDLEKKISELSHTIILFSILFILLALVIAILVSESITTPLKKLVHAIGKTDQNGIPVDTIPETGSTEIRLLASTMKNMIESVSRSRDALTESEGKFRSLVESSLDWIWEVDREGVYTYASPQAEILTGYKPAEIIGKTPFDFMPPEEAATIAGVFRKLVEKAQPVDALENVIVRKDGSYATLETSGVPVFNEAGKLTGYIGIDRDITQRKKMGDELEKTKNYIASIIDSMPSVVIGADTDGVVTLWNKKAEKTTGIAVKDATGKKLEALFPHLVSEIETIQESILTGEIKQHLKRKRTTETGPCYEDITIFPLITGGIEGAVIRVDDVTEKIRMEEVVIQSEKMLSVGGLAAGMAHEINNPLAALMQTAEVMAKRLTAGDLPVNIQLAEEAGTTMEAIMAFMERRGIRRMISAITESGYRIADIVSNMLNFSRKSDSVVSSHDISEIIDSALEIAAIDYDLKQHYDFKTIEIVKEYGDELPWVPCETAKIQQVLLNVLRNGAQAMQEAGTECPRFIIRTTHDRLQGTVVVEIEDNGPGMDEATRKRIFEPFFTTKPVGVGTGLGLSVSYFIITENHGGEMTVESIPGMGTTFSFCLPVPNESD